MESLPADVTQIHITIQKLGGGDPIPLMLSQECTFQVLMSAVAEFADVGPLSFKLLTQEGGILSGDPDTAIADLEPGLPDGAALTMITSRSRDYSRIKGPEKVFETGSYPAGILIDKSGNLYVSHYYGDLKVYNNNFELVRETKLPPQPKQLVLAPSGELVIVFRSRIGVFDLVSCECRRWFGTFSESRGIVIQENVVFASDSARSTIHRIRFDDGELLGTYSPGLRQPCGMAVVDGRLLAVADRSNHRIALLDVETLELQSQLPPEGTNQMLRSPNDVKMDGGGNLLVMDTGNGRIVVFREDGALVAVVLEGFFSVRFSTYCNLCYNEITGAIAVSNDDGHCITVFSPIFADVPNSAGENASVEDVQDDEPAK